jgi:hypothetical protein
MQMDESEEQYTKASRSIRESFDPGSNVTIDRFTHREKQSLHRISTDEGMQIDESEEQCANADVSIRESLEPASNVTIARLTHDEKQF